MRDIGALALKPVLTSEEQKFAFKVAFDEIIANAEENCPPGESDWLAAVHVKEEAAVVTVLNAVDPNNCPKPKPVDHVSVKEFVEMPKEAVDESVVQRLPSNGRGLFMTEQLCDEHGFELQVDDYDDLHEVCLIIPRD
jgi:hypothetical protein